MESKYKCNRCGKVVSVKVPNCPECSSCDGFDEIKTEPIPHFEILDEKALEIVEIGGYFTYTRGKMFRKGIRISHAMMVPVGLQCETLEGARNQN